MNFDFESVINRNGTHSVKWDHFDMKGIVDGMIPMSIADTSGPRLHNRHLHKK
jgi:bifunctional pyridoxal-dependent enzyme with beta-cystathionase and maltose regulon repressor activities